MGAASAILLVLVTILRKCFPLLLVREVASLTGSQYRHLVSTWLQAAELISSSTSASHSSATSPATYTHSTSNTSTTIAKSRRGRVASQPHAPRASIARGSRPAATVTGRLSSLAHTRNMRLTTTTTRGSDEGKTRRLYMSVMVSLASRMAL